MHIQTAKHTHLLKQKRRNMRLPFGTQRLLAMFEGIEGGFAIGASVVAGLSFASLDRRVLLLSAGISMIVNGFNSAAVKYSSEHYEDEVDGYEKKSPWKAYLAPALIEFTAYFVIAFAALLPLFFIKDDVTATVCCAIFTVVALFIAGYWRGFLMKLHPFKDGLELSLLGAFIIIVGAAAGYLLHL